jgi:hypothetical protein
MAKRKKTVLDEATWQTTTDSIALQTYMLENGLSKRRLQLFVVACGDLVWDTMRANCHIYFEALRRTAEKTQTANDRERLKECGPLPNWLDWCLNAGGKTKKLKAAAADTAREVFGNPFRPVKFSRDWRTSTAVTLAQQIYESREFSAMPILADALQDAGCDNDDVLNHCRAADAVHVRGCWVVDLVLGKK